MITEVAFPEFPEYREYLNDDGEKVYYNPKTGENIPAVTRVVPAGSIVMTQAKLEANKAYRERQAFMKRQKMERTEQQRVLGQYIFTAADTETFCDLPADMLARSIYLATYLRYNSDILWATQRTKMTRATLQGVMRLGTSATKNFWNAVKDKYFYADKDSVLHAKQGFFFGHLVAASPTEEYQKIYIAAIRELYEKIPPRQHKRLGYAFQMLPFLNFEYNILCRNPKESRYSEIDPLTVADFCEQIGFDRTHASHLASEYGRLTFTVDGGQEIFCKFLSDGRDITTANIYINPRLVYKGTNFRQVEAVGISFAADARKR